MNDEKTPDVIVKASPKTIALKFFAITALIIGWSLTLGIINASGISLGALPMMIISAPFIYGWWKLFKSPGGNIAMLVFILLIAGGVLLILFLNP